MPPQTYSSNIDIYVDKQIASKNKLSLSGIIKKKLLHNIYEINEIKLTH